MELSLAKCAEFKMCELIMPHTGDQESRGRNNSFPPRPFQGLESLKLERVRFIPMASTPEVLLRLVNGNNSLTRLSVIQCELTRVGDEVEMVGSGNANGSVSGSRHGSRNGSKESHRDDGRSQIEFGASHSSTSSQASHRGFRFIPSPSDGDDYNPYLAAAPRFAAPQPAAPQSNSNLHSNFNTQPNSKPQSNSNSSSCHTRPAPSPDSSNNILHLSHLTFLDLSRNSLSKIPNLSGCPLA